MEHLPKMANFKVRNLILSRDENEQLQRRDKTAEIVGVFHLPRISGNSGGM